MGEQPLFLEGQPPDFSLLQRLLCLDPEPCDPPVLPPPSPGGAATTGTRRTGVPEPPRWPWSPPGPPGEGLTFLQETVRLLSPPGHPPAPPAARPETSGVPPVPTGSPDPLSLISLKCRHLDGGTGTSNGSSKRTGIDTGIDTGTNNGAGIDTGKSNGTSKGTGIDTGKSNGTSKGTGIDTGKSNGTSKGTGIDTGNSNGTSKGTGIHTGASNGMGTGIGAGIDTETSTSTGTSNGIGTGTNTGTGVGRRRKQATPQRGADPQDPSFRGVTLRMRLGVPTGGTDGWRLLITARHRRKPPRSRGSSSSEDEAPTAQGHKRCASCKTRRTPLWRAAENGTPLCNACGIRYRKYRVRCRRCWNVPGRTGTPRPPCPHCAGWGPPAPRGDRR